MAASAPGEARWQAPPQEPAPGPGSVAAIAAASLHTSAELPPGAVLGPMQQMLLEGAPSGDDVQMAEGSAPLPTQSMKALSLEPSPSGSVSPFALAPAVQTSSEESDTESDEKQVLLQCSSSCKSDLLLMLPSLLLCHSPERASVGDAQWLAQAGNFAALGTCMIRSEA